MSSELRNELNGLIALTTTNCGAEGEQLCLQLEAAGETQLLWLTDLIGKHQGSSATCLLIGALDSMREVAACLALGLVRPALNSLRLQMDLSMAWLYFKDHPVEWSVIQETGENFKLKKELLEYLNKWHKTFPRRWGILGQLAKRQAVDPYRLLSAHVHGQSEVALPGVARITDVVGPPNIQLEVVQLQEDVAEYVSDLFWAVFADSWRGLPLGLSQPFMQRFRTAKQKAEFFGH